MVNEVNLPRKDVSMSVVKGVAIILMVLGHAEAPSFVTNFIYLFHMPVFFMAAGYFFAERYLDQPWQFVVRRVKGLYVPFVKWSLFFLVIHNLMFALGILNEQYGNWSGGVTHPYSGRDMLQRAVHIIFSMGGYDEFLAGAFWFFRALLLASLAYLALRLLLRRMAARLGVQGLSPVTASIIICVAALGFALVKINWHLRVATVVQGGIRETWGVFFFSAGVVARYAVARFVELYAKGSRPAMLMRRLLPATVVMLAGLLCFGASRHWAGMNLSPKLADVATLPLTGIAGFIVLLCMSRWLAARSSALARGVTRSLAYVGGLTVYIYVFHIIAFKVVSAVKIWWFGLDPAQIGCHMVIHDLAPSDGFWVLYTVAGVCLPLAGVALWRRMAPALRAGIASLPPLRSRTR